MYRPRSLKPFRRPWLWAGLWLLAIAAVVIASLLPATDLPPVPRGFDKLEHGLAYAVLAALAVQLFGKRIALFSACVALVAMGIGLEHAQAAWTAGRQLDMHDAVANGIGVLAGLGSLFTPWRDALLRHDRARAR